MLVLVKFLILCVLLLITSWVGIILSRKYSNRVKELKQIKTGLNICENKNNFTYEPSPEIFEEIGLNFTGNVSDIVKKACESMKDLDAGKAWIHSGNKIN